MKGLIFSGWWALPISACCFMSVMFGSQADLVLFTFVV
jgi:hypothetical protein